MTKRETQIIETAIDAIMSADGFGDGVDALCKLVGKRYPPAAIQVQAATIAELVRTPESEANDD